MKTLTLLVLLVTASCAQPAFAGELTSDSPRIANRFDIKVDNRVSYTVGELSRPTTEPGGSFALRTSPAQPVSVPYKFQAPPAPRSLGFAAYYSFCSKTPCAIVMQRVGGIDNAFGLHISPDVSLFTGPGIDGIVRAGGSVTLSWTPQGSNLSFIAGLGADWPIQDFEIRKVGVGLVLGARWDVRF